MKKIMKLFLKPSGNTMTPHNRGFSAKPNAQWKRNTFAILAGLGLGLYIGQYFPDVFYAEVEPYIPEVQQLRELSLKLVDYRPNPLYPKSLWDYPKDALVPERAGFNLKEGTYSIVNDVTKKHENIKVTRVFKPEDEEE